MEADRRKELRWLHAAFNAPVVAILIIALVAIAVLYDSKETSDRRLLDVSAQLDETKVQLDAQNERTECIRSLSLALQDKAVDNSLAFNRYVIGLGQRGDIAGLQADLDAAGLALQQARDAYVAQACPGS